MPGAGGAFGVLCFGALVAVFQLALTAPAAAQATPAPVPITPVGFHASGLDPSSADPVRVWVLGDSVMNDGSPAVAAALAATGEAQVVADSSIGGWGLTTQTAWAEDSSQIIEDYHPQMIVGTWSWDDPLVGSNPKLYSALLDRALGVWLTPGDGVHLVALIQFPPVGPNTFIKGALERLNYWITVTAEQDAWDRIARSMVDLFPGRVVYLSTAQVFAPGGRFLTWVRTAGGTWARVRQVDNAHLCVLGATEFGQTVVGDLQSILGLPAPAAGWQDGPWTGDLRYEIGPFGRRGCPAGGPPDVGYRGLAVPDPAGLT